MLWAIMIYHLVVLPVGFDTDANGTIQTYPTEEACNVALAHKELGIAYSGACKPVPGPVPK